VAERDWLLQLLWLREAVKLALTLPLTELLEL
jgi:hypothetical protein